MPTASPDLTDWQKRSRTRLRELARQNDDIRISDPITRTDDYLSVRLTLDLTSMSRAEGGLPIRNVEQVTIHIAPGSLVPPKATVNHARFLGYPHVLGGYELCLYLDPSREWDPSQGMTGYLNHLWKWFDDAANNRFDANTALYHAVGGYAHLDTDKPFIVIRHPLTTETVQPGHLTERTPRRLDHHPTPPAGDQQPCPVFLLRQDLPFGAGAGHLADLLRRIDASEHSTLKPDPNKPQLKWPTAAAEAVTARRNCPKAPRHPGYWDPRPPEPLAPTGTSTALLTALAAVTSRRPNNTSQHILLGVPHPAGGPHHLLALHLPADDCNALRRATRNRRAIITNLATKDVAPNVDMEWSYVSDERSSVTTRRDHERPVHALQGTNVHIWGCGGLGSWIAEYVVRAGAADVTICDPSLVTGGILVRQNYREADVGQSKGAALAQRLRELSDTTRIHLADGALPDDVNQTPHTADVIIDATVSHPIGLFLNALAAAPNRTATIAKVATDVRTGTLGLLIVSTPTDPATPAEIDNHAGEIAKHSADLEDYRTFWDEPAPGDELTPTRGCSAPTFHGSAADMAAIAGTLLNYLALAHQSGTTGAHLLALPQSGVTPAVRHIRHSTSASTTQASA